MEHASGSHENTQSTRVSSMKPVVCTRREEKSTMTKT
jgi:hypothetical protein